MFNVNTGRLEVTTQLRGRSRTEVGDEGAFTVAY